MIRDAVCLLCSLFYLFVRWILPLQFLRTIRAIFWLVRWNFQLRSKFFLEWGNHCPAHCLLLHQTILPSCFRKTTRYSFVTYWFSCTCNLSSFSVQQILQSSLCHHKDRGCQNTLFPQTLNFQKFYVRN